VRAGLKLLGWVGGAGAALVLLVLLFWDTGWLNVSPELQSDVTWCLILAALSIPVTTLTSGLKGVLEGVERFRDVNLLRTLLGVANFVSPVVAVSLRGPSLTVIVLFLVMARVIILALHALLVRRAVDSPAGDAAILDRSAMRGLFAFGSWMTVSAIVAPLMVVADRFLIANVVGAAMVAYYSVPGDVLLRLLIIPAALSSTIFPAFTRHMVNDVDTARQLYRRSSLAVLCAMGPLMLSIALGSHLGLSLWLGKDFADHAYVCVAILSGGILLNSLAQVPFALVQAARQVKWTGLLHLGEFIVYAPLLYWTTRRYGINGAAAVWAMRAGIDLMALNWMARRILRPAMADP
jgi:O-antigen/teichoic acid export membrane protein